MAKAVALTDEPTRTLYHYTAPTTSHLGGILASGVIETTESNLSFEVARAGPPVVWLTDSDRPTDQLWASTTPASQAVDDALTTPNTLPPEIKTRAVLIVELPASKVFHWPAWSQAHDIDPAVYQGLAETGGDPESWWVATEPIRRWDVTALTIAPYRLDGAVMDLRQFTGADLRKLFESAGARRALNLIEATKRQVRL